MAFRIAVPATAAMARIVPAAPRGLGVTFRITEPSTAAPTTTIIVIVIVVVSGAAAPTIVAVVILVHETTAIIT